MHLLEASTGKEQHKVGRTGRNAGAIADLDGDGLGDLWGEAGGELRAFRGEAPEAWRALGRFTPAGVFDRGSGITGNSEVDFDRDGVADTLVSDLAAPGTHAQRTTGSRTAVARSGRDGHVIWKTAIDQRGSWFEPRSGSQYELSAFPAPEGDLNGDGIADVIVRKKSELSSFVASDPEVTTVIEVLSGRGGARLWIANVAATDLAFINGTSDWLEPRVIEPGRGPDLIARRGMSRAMPALGILGTRWPHFVGEPCFGRRTVFGSRHADALLCRSERRRRA